MEIPQFSSLTEVSLNELVERLLYLDVPDTVATLRRIFPATQVADDTEVYAERDAYARAWGMPRARASSIRSSAPLG